MSRVPSLVPFDGASKSPQCVSGANHETLNVTDRLAQSPVLLAAESMFHITHWHICATEHRLNFHGIQAASLQLQSEEIWETYYLYTIHM